MTLLTQLAARPEWHHHRGLRLVWLLLLVALLVLVVVLIVRNWSRPAPTSATSATPVRPRASAEDLLAERLARGEIDVDEYRQRRDALRSP